MRIIEKFSVFLIFCVMVCYCNVKNETNVTDVFVPTNEWQVVKKGQSIPKGLHVRVNFETGVTEAKLLNPDDNPKAFPDLEGKGEPVAKKHQFKNPYDIEDEDEDYEIEPLSYPDHRSKMPPKPYSDGDNDQDYPQMKRYKKLKNYPKNEYYEYPSELHVKTDHKTESKSNIQFDTESNDYPKDKQKSLSVMPDQPSDNKTQKIEDEKRHKKLTKLFKDEIEEALKNIPSDRYDLEKNKYRTMEELKAEFQDLQMEIKTDVEIMRELFSKYEIISKLFPTSNTFNDKLDQESVDSFVSVEMLNILTDMEYLVHQYDNGIEFVKMKGFEKMIYPHLNASDATLKAEAIKLMGSCLQNNVQVQIHALETNAGDHLLKILALEKNEHVKEKAVYALGALVRRFPLAQRHIVSNHGLDVLIQVLLSENPAYVKLKLKVLSLLEDLLVEHQSVLENHVSGDADQEEKLRQYYQVDLISKLSNPATCQILSKMLHEFYEYDSTNIDNIDKVFSVIISFSHMCKHHHYKDNKLLLLFHKIQTSYVKIVKSRMANAIPILDPELIEDDTEFYQKVLTMIDNYINELNDAKIKDEL